MIRVIIVDDQQVIRRGFRLFLDGADDIEVVGEASSGPDAVGLARREAADVVLMDIRMPGGDGLSATRELAGPGVDNPIPVIVVTTFDTDEYLYSSLENGAVGFILKDTDPDDLVDAVRAAARGDGLVSPAVTKRIIGEFARRRPPITDADHTASAVLSPREIDIVRALAEGLSNAEIGARLFLEVSTVKSHLGRITTKLDLRDRVQIVVWAFRHGVADPTTEG